MKFSVSVLTLACLAGLAHGWTSIANQIGQIDNAQRPRLSAMLAHLERNNKIKWEDQGLGGGALVAVYDMKDWHDAKAHLNSLDAPPAGPRATLAPRMPQDDSGDSEMPGGSIVPTLPDETTSTTAVSSGTSTAAMADNTNHVTKWVCKQPFNMPVALAQGALASVICQYLFPFLQNLFTGPADTVIQRTVTVPAVQAENPTLAARVAIHVEKNQLWPAMKAVLCSSLIVQIANNAYCWGYGEGFQTSGRVKRQSTLDGTVGGTLWIYDTSSTVPVGLIEMETLED